MSSQLDCMVPLFDGSNYRTWATSMTAFLHSQRLWGIVSGREGRPSDLPSGRAAVAATRTSPAQPAIPPPTQDEVSERQRAQREWTEKDHHSLERGVDVRGLPSHPTPDFSTLYTPLHLR